MLSDSGQTGHWRRMKYVDVAVGKLGREYLPESAGARRHNKHWGHWVSSEVVEDLLPARKSVPSIDPLKGYRLLAQVPRNQIQGLGPTGEDYTITMEELDLRRDVLERFTGLAFYFP